MTQTLPPPQIPDLAFLSKLGSGGYADVYLYEQRMPNRRVAVKVLREPGLAAGIVARFTAEANAMAQLEHPNIVPVYSAATAADGRPYLVMMYYPNASLAERAKRERFGVAEVLRIGIQISSAVETAHRCGFLHRDIKPANILTSQYGTPGLTDFGIAAQVAEAEEDDAGVSVPWSPVETLYATGPATVRSDVYSLAATLWHLLVGRSPFEIPGGDNSTFALMRRVRDVPAPSTGRSDVPTSLDRLLRTAMAKEPNVRPASALQLARALQAIEQELRFPRTDIVVAGDEAAPVALPPSTWAAPAASGPAAAAASAPVEEDGTRLRAPQQVRAQGPAPAAAYPPVPAFPHVPGSGSLASGHVAVPPEDATLRRQGRTDGVTHVGVRLPQAPEAGRRRELIPEPPDDGPVRRGGTRWGVVALAALVVVAAAVVGVWQLSGKSATDVGPAPTRTPTQPLPELGAGAAPGKVTIKGERAGGDVTFTWTYPNALASDWYMVRTGGPSGTTQRVEDPKVVVADAGRVCVAVKVFRASGADAPQNYSEETCA